MIKLPDELKEKVEKIIEEILDSDLLDSGIEDLSRKWVEYVREVLDYNKLDYSEEDLEELKDAFLKRLELVRKNKDLDSVDREDI